MKRGNIHMAAGDVLYVLLTEGQNKKAIVDMCTMQERFFIYVGGRANNDSLSGI